MGIFDEKIEDLETDELQARLKGLVAKVIAQQSMWSSDADKYERIITELARRGESPEAKLVPKN